jgi:hypothetical protein
MVHLSILNTKVGPKEVQFREVSLYKYLFSDDMEYIFLWK